MNIHPIFIHFPIALLTIYAIAEFLQFKKLKSQIYFFYIKAVLVITGVLSAFLALYTGGIAEDLQGKDTSIRLLIEKHSVFANISTWVFIIIASAYLVSWIEKTEYNQKLFNSKFSKIWKLKTLFANKILNTPIVVILALIGLVVITITGALGGAMVYGPDVDPVVRFIYHLFF